MVSCRARSTDHHEGTKVTKKSEEEGKANREEAIERQRENSSYRFSS
jgi:hypothetical protein